MSEKEETPDSLKANKKKTPQEIWEPLDHMHLEKQLSENSIYLTTLYLFF